MGQADLIGDRGQAIRCWVPLPGQYLAVSAYPTPQAVADHYRATRVGADHPDLCRMRERYPDLFREHDRRG